MCVLLVEDEDLVREVLADGLDSQGFEVCEAYSGDHAADPIQNPLKAFGLLNYGYQYDSTTRWCRSRAINAFMLALNADHLYDRGIGFKVSQPLETNEVLLRKPFSLQQLTQVARMLLDRS